MPKLITKLTTAGNSRALRLPKELLKQSGLNDYVELEVKQGRIIVSKLRNPRAGWRQAIEADLAKNGPLIYQDEYGDLVAENDATLNDGLD